MAPSKKKQLKAKKVHQFDTSAFRPEKYKSNPRTPEGRYCLGKLVSENPQNVSAYSKQTGESERYLKIQAKMYKEDKPFRNVGQPLVCNESMIAHISAIAKAGDDEGTSPGEKKLRKDLSNLAAKEGRLQNGRLICKKTFNRAMKKAGLKSRVSQPKNAARKEAQRDVRNFVTAAAGFKALLTNKSPQLIFNFDASTYLFNSYTTKRCLVPHVRDESMQVQGEDNGKGLNVCIKYMAIICADGSIAPPICIITDDGLETHECRWNRVPCGVQAFSCHPQTAWLVVMHSSAKTVFNETFLKHRLPEFVDSIRDSLQLSTDLRSRAVVFSDGEKEQIDVLRDGVSEYLAKKKQMNMCKLPSSTSGSLQPADVCDLFKHSKSYVSNWGEHRDEELRYNANLLECFTDVLEHEDNGLSRKQPKCKNPKAKTFAEGLVAVSCGLERVITRKVIRQGFIKTGIYPLDPRKTLAQCRPAPQKEAVEHIVVALNDLSEAFSTQGAISEAQLDDAKVSDSIYKQANAKQLSKKPRKDERIVTQQRMVLITPDALKYLESIKKEKERVKSVKRDTIATQKEALKKCRAECIALKAKLAAARKQSEPARPKDGPAHPKLPRERCSSACSSKPRAPPRAQRVEVDLSKPSVDDKGRLECSTCRKKYNFQDSTFCGGCKAFFACSRNNCRAALKSHYQACQSKDGSPHLVVA